MHIPDNYLSPATCGVMLVVMAPIWVISVKKVTREMDKSRLPSLGVGAAFAFLIMMFNVPLPGGTTGHAIGSTLLAVLFGPFAACLALTVALAIQALLFGDGGVLAFGANAFNMAFVAPFLGYAIYSLIKRMVATTKGEYVAVMIGSYVGVNFAAFMAAVEFGIQPLLFKGANGLPLYCPYPLSISIPAMLIPHLLVVGFLEAFFSVLVFTFIKKVAPNKIYQAGARGTKFIYGLLIILVCLSPLGLLASGSAWGEWKVDQIKGINIANHVLGYIPEGFKHEVRWRHVLIEDYSIEGVPAMLSYIMSAVAGVFLLIIIFKVLSVLLSNHKLRRD